MVLRPHGATCLLGQTAKVPQLLQGGMLGLWGVGVMSGWRPGVEGGGGEGGCVVGRVENGDFELFVWLYSFFVGFLCVETRNAKD